MATETTETEPEFGAPPADPFEDGQETNAPDPAEGGPEPDEEPRAAVRDEPDEPGARSPNETAGKRIVFAARGELGPFQPIPEERVEGDDSPPAARLFAGDDKTVRLDALEQSEQLAEAAKAGELWLATVPASSWKPRQAAPRPRKSDWAV